MREALREKRVGDLGVLVEAGGEADRMVEPHVEEADGEAFIGHPRQAGSEVEPHRRDGQRVGDFQIEAPKHGRAG